MRGARPALVASGWAGGQIQTSLAAFGEAVSGSAGSARAGPGDRCSGAGCRRRLGGSRLAEVREGAVQVRGFLLAPSCFVWARGASRESRRPEGGSEVRAPLRKAPAGIRRFELSLDFKNPPLCACVERCQAPRPPSFTFPAFNWCREPGVRVRASGLGAPGARAHPRAPAPRRTPHPELREGWAERIHCVPVIFPGNLSFRRYTCAYLSGGATTEGVFFSQFILDGVFGATLPSLKGGGGLFRLTFGDKVSPGSSSSN